MALSASALAFARSQLRTLRESRLDSSASRSNSYTPAQTRRVSGALEGTLGCRTGGPVLATRAMPRVVKRYANRKLYDTTTSRYVALDDIAVMVRSGEEVEVTDNETGADLTAVTLAQIILEDERRKKSLLSLPLLRQIVQYGDKLADATNRGIEALGEFRERAERRVTEIVNEGPNLIDDVLSGSRQRIDELQRRIDDGLRQSMGRLRSAPGIGAEIDRLEQRLKELDGRIRQMVARQNGGASPDAGSPKASGTSPGGGSSDETR